jgi:predicted AlkP superfamily phosphohydrolase/phosphomutase
MYLSHPFGTARKRNRIRVIVVGIDGASWDIINRMVELGAMPYLEHALQGDAARGILESSYPPVTPSAWPTITTGVNPGKHGIFDFVHTNPDTGEQKLTTSLDLEHPRIYEMLAMKGIETLVFNPIPSYPLIQLKNLKVASIVFSPKPIGYPDWMTRYSSRFPDYSEQLDAQTDGRRLDKEKYWDIKIDRTHQRAEVIEEALRQESWSFAWIRLQDPDDMLHYAGDEVFSGHPKAAKVFGIIDDLIQRSQTLADLLIILSDHGFRKYERVVHINTLLHKHQLANSNRGRGLANHDELMRRNDIPGIIEDRDRSSLRIPLWLQTSYAWANSRIPLVSRLQIGHRFMVFAKMKYEFPKVNALVSKAFLPTPYSSGVFLRDTNCYETTKNVLSSCKGIRLVIPREEVYWGNHVGRAPHIITFPDYDKGYKIGSNRITSTVLEQTPVWDHHPDGIIVFVGEHLERKRLGRVKAWDVAPTIMNYFRVPIPSDTDGTILGTVFAGSTSETSHYDYTMLWRRKG